MKARQPEDTDRLFGEHVNAGEVDAAAALYEDEAVLVVPGGEPVRGRAAIRAAIAQLVAADLRLAMKVTTVLRSGDVAVLYNDWTGSMAGPDGERVEIRGKAIEVVRRQADGSWLFVVDDPNARG